MRRQGQGKHTRTKPRPEPVAGPAGPGRGAGGRRQGQSKHTRTPDRRPSRGLQGLAAVPEGGGRARAGLEIDHSER